MTKSAPIFALLGHLQAKSRTAYRRAKVAGSKGNKQEGAELSTMAIPSPPSLVELADAPGEAIRVKNNKPQPFRFWLLQTLSCLAVAAAFGWLLFHLYFVWYVSLQLGHFPRPMADDPKLILLDDRLYQALFAFVTTQGALWWCLVLSGTILVRLLGKYTEKDFRRTRWYFLLTHTVVALIAAPMIGGRLLLWIAD